MASSEASTTTRLTPLPISHRQGQFFLHSDPSPLQHTFESITNASLPSRLRIPRRVPEVRRALALSLRHSLNPDLLHQGPWVPDHPRFQPFRTTITPLLEHPLWQTSSVIAAPFLTFIPHRRIAGPIDVILRLPDGSYAIAILLSSRRLEHLIPAARSELGGAIAAICDHLTLLPAHAITIWAAADNTEIEYHQPDLCLGLWVDALDRTRTPLRFPS